MSSIRARLFLLSNRLTADNVDALLAETRGKTRREIERVLARWFPKSDVLPMVVPLRAEPGVLAGTGGAIARPETGDWLAVPEVLRQVKWSPALGQVTWSAVRAFRS